MAISRVAFIIGFTHDVLCERYPMHTHDAVEIVWHAGGRGVDILENTDQRHFEANSVVIHGHRAAHGQMNSETGIDRCMSLQVQRELQSSIGAYTYIPNITDSVLQQEMLFLSSNEQHPHRQQAIFDLRAEAVLISLLQLSDSASKNNEHSVIHKLTQAQTFMNKHFHECISIKNVAQYVGLSEDYFRHQFKDVYKITPLDYIVRHRIAHAKQLLQHTSLKQQAIAEQSGFQNVRYFNTRFSHYVGISPGSFRKSMNEVV